MSFAEPAQPPHDDALRILHWNIHSWRDPSGASNVAAVARLISETEPHVVCLVEVGEPWGVPASLNDLANRLGYTWIFVPAFEFGHHEPAGGFGNALLVRPPVRAVQQWQLLWPPTLYDGTEPSEPRAAVFVRLAYFVEPLWVASTHLPSSDAQARTQALRRLTTLTHKLDGQWLICGDFNTPASSWLDIAGTIHAYPDPAQPTYPTHNPTEPIDYCIASTGLTIEARTLTVTGSDHLPLLIFASSISHP